jgi:uncharacterized protein
MSTPWRIFALLVALAVIAAAVVVLVAPVREAVLNLVPPRQRIALLAWRHGFTVDHDVRLTMPDGVVLTASLYLPREAQPPLAAVLVRLPYGRMRYDEAYYAGAFFAGHGYAVLVEDLRGTGDSGGELLPWRDVESDGAATLDWITRQSWSNGKVGTFGCSALGETQLVLARRRHPAHAALIASGAGGAIGTLGGRYGYFGLYEGGVFQLASGFGWFAEHGTLRPDAPRAQPFDVDAQLRTLPLADMVARVRPAPNGFSEFLNTPLGDPRWDEWGYLREGDTLDRPMFIINTWGDQTLADSLVIAEAARATGGAVASHNRVVIAPGDHCKHPESRSFDDWYLRWFDRWLRGQGNGLDDEPAYTYYMLGEDRWYSSAQWPPAEASLQRWYLSGGHANTAAGDGKLGLAPPSAEGSDQFVYDPANPVPTRGGPICCTGDPRQVSGMVDQRDVEDRADVLVFTSEPLDAELRIAGPVRASLLVSSDAPDTDLVAKLVDVAPDGVATNIQEGALRLRYRDGVPAKLLQPGERYRVTVDMRAIAYRLPRGHRLRLDLTGSNFPRLERNLNTGGDNYRATEMRRATTAIHHGPVSLSSVELYSMAR